MNNKEYQKQYYLFNKKKLNSINTLYRINNREKCIWLGAKTTAKRKKLEFNITIEDIIIPEYCPYLGCRLTNTPNQKRIYSNSSIDRIDSSLGYIKGNVQIISDLANRMKTNSSIENLLKFARGVLKIHG